MPRAKPDRGGLSCLREFFALRSLAKAVVVAEPVVYWFIISAVVHPR
jgi:hypothetical protein